MTTSAVSSFSSLARSSHLLNQINDELLDEFDGGSIPLISPSSSPPIEMPNELKILYDHVADQHGYSYADDYRSGGCGVTLTKGNVVVAFSGASGGDTAVDEDEHSEEEADDIPFEVRVYKTQSCTGDFLRFDCFGVEVRSI